MANTLLDYKEASKKLGLSKEEAKKLTASDVARLLFKKFRLPVTAQRNTNLERSKWVLAGELPKKKEKKADAPAKKKKSTKKASK